MLTMKTRTGTGTNARLTKGAVALVMAAALFVAPAANAAPADDGKDTSSNEAAGLAILYAKAKAEGGKVTAYMGGDLPGQWDALRKAFTQQFPGIDLDIVVDLSKYHDARIDNQLANRALVPDVAILQTVQDFDRWKKEGALLKYLPIGADRIYATAKDSDGYWTGVFYGGFAAMISKNKLHGAPSTFKATDLAAPQYKDKLIFTYPNDDDAVLFGFKLLVDKYGWDWLKLIAAQSPTLVRGVPNSSAGVSGAKYLASLATAGDPGASAVAIYDNGDPFVSWAQRAAIFKAAAHPEAAKLFLSWLVSEGTQKNAIATWTWPVRSDVSQPAWLKPLAAYKNTDPTAFPKFMSDRGAVERFRTELELYLGPVAGPDPASPATPLGLAPGA
jgi:ABC-type Fe3+ transport system substrate-binding protein